MKKIPFTQIILQSRLSWPVPAEGICSYTFAWASFSQDMPSWIEAHVRAFRFFGGVSEILMPDNLKSGITKPNHYEPDINPWEYLNDMLRRIMYHTVSRLRELLPDQWEPLNR
jgi:hypothetical protein